ncbi:MAG: methylenetetrahydrofolate reductase [NAD(P)H] [Spirochaetes bacterium]|nr:methylenetetrahydrofolate reductase [NAD(P)H] [Spirochaetota bacterium]
MNLMNRLQQKKTMLSFEVFPPKTKIGEENLFHELSVMVRFKPDFISVTYGAGGSTREKTLEIALSIKTTFAIEPLIHFTCVGQSKQDIAQYLNHVKSLGFHNILALRGDPPAGQNQFKPHPEGFRYANELVEFIRSMDNFTIGVAGYPEGHIEAPDLDTDITNLKRKVDAGASFIITQLFFNNDKFYTFMDKTAKAGITVPIIPGIMPLTNMAQLQKVTAMCNPDIPAQLLKELQRCTLPDDICKVGIEFTINQCRQLQSFGVPGFHFYPLNKSAAVVSILEEFWHG